MGIFSEIDLEQKTGIRDGDNPFAEEPSVSPVDTVQQIVTAPAPVAAAQNGETPAAVEQEVPAGIDAASEEDKTDDDEATRRQAHEEAEAKRKAEWEAKQQAKKAAEQEQLDKLAAMSTDEVMMAATQRIGSDVEKLTRRNMKEFIAEHIQTKCLDDPEFAMKVMHPRKSMIHCIWYINRKARDYLRKEMELNDERPEANGIYGGDVPDDLCYQWSEDYFNDPNAEEDKENEEKFVPKPYFGKTTSKSKTAKNKKETAKKTASPAKGAGSGTAPQCAEADQITLGGFGKLKESA